MIFHKKLCGILSIMLTCVILASSPNVFANTDIEARNAAEDITDLLFDNVRTKINRVDCVAVILNVLGLNADDVKYFENISYTVPIYHDAVPGAYGYLIASWEAGITTGETDEYGERYFRILDDITVKEYLALVLRCINGANNVDWNDVENESVSSGLLSEHELSLMNTESPVDRNIFKKVLERILESKRYIYFERGEDLTDVEIKYDVNGSKTYLEQCKDIAWTDCIGKVNMQLFPAPINWEVYGHDDSLCAAETDISETSILTDNNAELLCNTYLFPIDDISGCEYKYSYAKSVKYADVNYLVLYQYINNGGKQTLLGYIMVSEEADTVYSADVNKNGKLYPANILWKK